MTIMTGSVARKLNKTMRHFPAGKPGTLPCTETLGVQVATFWMFDGELVVSVSLDPERIPAGLLNEDGTLPLRVEVGGTVIFNGGR
ncbi:hypothetical protein [Streptomyces sp. NPDC097619]|uniref:hypothetical protein n=1 Tax=Streptomyces sp. NPDC097619 TaxID=3157228 RepID=UPI00331F8575